MKGASIARSGLIGLSDRVEIHALRTRGVRMDERGKYRDVR